MMTPEDKRLNDGFRERVASEFRLARERAKAKGMSIEQFVASLGITRAALCKYVNAKAIPSLRVLRRARQYHGVNLNYGELGDRYLSARRKDPRQMEFQFTIMDNSKDQIVIKRFSPKGESSAELLLSIDFSKRA
jgi:transcriptional regulator with XRE-family HTH domain